MNNKKILIVSSIVFFLVGGVVGVIIGTYVKGSDKQVSESSEKNSIVEEVKKDDGSEFVGNWKKEGQEEITLVISKPSKSTITIDKEKRHHMVAEYKDGVMIADLKGDKFTYVLEDGILTEKSSGNYVRKYEKAE